jgi:hypothetical protein
MIDNLPPYITIGFIITTLLTLLLFNSAVSYSNSESVRNNSKAIFLGLTIWLLLQALLSYKNVYCSSMKELPPRIFLMGIMPMNIIIILLFISKKGRAFMDSLDLSRMALINTVRIPVEIILYLLYINKAIPEILISWRGFLHLLFMLASKKEALSKMDY